MIEESSHREIKKKKRIEALRVNNGSEEKKVKNEEEEAKPTNWRAPAQLNRIINILN